MSKASGSISIIIPNWNGRELLEKNLPVVLLATKNKKNNICEVIVVDDGSTDTSVKFLKKNFKGEIRLFRHTKNRGFAASCNMGARMAKGELLCLLNTDVVPEKNFLENIGKHFTDLKVFAVGLHEKGSGPSSGTFKEGLFAHKNAGEKNSVQISLWASGGSAVFRRSIWKALKGFDEELLHPFYWEDTDLSYRAWKRGFIVLWEPTAKVTHKHESIINNTNFKKRYTDMTKERNELLFIWKNITSPALFRKHISYIISRVIKHPGYLKVVRAALSKRKLVRRLRAIEMKEASVSDEAVFSKFV